MQSDILIVDDEADIRRLIQGILEDEGHTTRGADGAESAYAAIAKKTPDLVILDIWLQGSSEDGIQILEKIKRDLPDLPVIMISGHGTIETAVSALKVGAYDFIEKPFKSDRLLLMIERAMENAVLRRENTSLRRQAETLQDQLVDHSPITQQIKNLLSRSAPTNSRILITGEIGTGKNLAARYIHAHSKRANKAFTSINCATQHPERLEVELFGSVDGVLNEPAKLGVLEIAEGGTLLLDEVSRMPIETQGKLLRFLQDGTYQKIGGKVPIVSDVRVLATCSEDIQRAMQEGRMRQDLYYRLNVVSVHMPALRDQRQDIPDLVSALMRQITHGSNVASKPFSLRAMSLMQNYAWPGNVRQLRNVLEWVCIMAGSLPESDIYEPDHLPPEIIGKTTSPQEGGNVSLSMLSGNILDLTLREAREKFEQDYLKAQVQRFGGNISKTAQFVGMERSALHRKLKSLDVIGGDKDDETTQGEEEKRAAIG